MNTATALSSRAHAVGTFSGYASAFGCVMSKANEGLIERYFFHIVCLHLASQWTW